MEREPSATSVPPNAYAAPGSGAPRRDHLWLALTLLTAAFVAFAVAVFLRAGLPLSVTAVPAQQSTPGAPAMGDFAALAPDLSDWQQSPGCAFDGTVFTAQVPSSGATVCLAPTGPVGDVDSTIAIRLATADAGEFAGLVLGETDGDHFYTLGVSASGLVALDQWSAAGTHPQYRELRAGPSPQPPDATGWLHLHLIASGDSCFITIQATVVTFSTEDPDAPAGCAFPGRIGVFVRGANDSAQFAHFSLSVPL